MASWPCGASISAYVTWRRLHTSASTISRLRSGVAAAGTHGDQAVLGLNHVTVAGDDQGRVFVGDGKHGFQAAEGAVGAPLLGQLDSGAHQMALVFFQLAFETFE